MRLCSVGAIRPKASRAAYPVILCLIISLAQN